MLKKDILFGSVVLLLAALFALTGCSQATNSDGGTAAYSENHLFGIADAAAVKRAVDSARKSGRAVVLTDQVVITGANVITDVADFEDMTVRVEGNVTIGGNASQVIINAVKANLIFEEDALITLLGGATFLYSGSSRDEDIRVASTAAATAFKVKFLDDPIKNQGTDTRIAVSNYHIGDPVNTNNQHLYVLDTLTVDPASLAPDGVAGSGRPFIHALGNVELTGSNIPLFFGAFATGPAGSEFTGTAVLTSAVPGGVSIDVPAAVQFPAIKAAVPIAISVPANGTPTIQNVLGPETVTVVGATPIGSITINDVDATGKLVVSTDTLTAATILKNSGSITFDVATFGATGLTIPLPNAVPVAGTGINNGDITIKATTFNGPVTIPDNKGTLNVSTAALTATSVITVPTNSGNINFTQNIAVPPAGAVSVIRSPNNSGAINFQGTFASTGILGDAVPAAVPGNRIAGSGKVVFEDTATFTSGSPNIDCDVVFNGPVTVTVDPIYFGGNVTLAYSNTISLSATTSLINLKKGSAIGVAGTPVLVSDSPMVAITPGAAGILTAGRPYNDALDTIDETLYLGDKTLATGVALTYTGALRIASGGVFEVAVAAGITPSANGLIIDAGGTLALADDAGGGAFTVGMGTTTITGVADAQSRLTAVGGPVTLTPNKIFGNGSTLAIASADDDFANTVISLASGGNTLTIEGANLDLSLNGTLTIIGVSGTASKVELIAGINPGKITLGEDFGDPITINFTTSPKKLDAGAYTPLLSGTGVIRGDIDADDITGDIGDLSANSFGGSVTITGDSTGTNNAVITAGVGLID